MAECISLAPEHVEETVMSLLSDAMEICVMQDKTTVADGYGGFINTWRDGAEFKAAIVLDNSTEARIAAVQGVTALYTITTGREINLQYHDVFKRKRDGKIFRVTSDGDDKATPASTALNMRQVSGEEWEIPHG